MRPNDLTEIADPMWNCAKTEAFDAPRTNVPIDAFPATLPKLLTEMADASVCIAIEILLPHLPKDLIEIVDPNSVAPNTEVRIDEPKWATPRTVSDNPALTKLLTEIEEPSIFAPAADTCAPTLVTLLTEREEPKCDWDKADMFLPNFTRPPIDNLPATLHIDLTEMQLPAVICVKHDAEVPSLPNDRTEMFEPAAVELCSDKTAPAIFTAPRRLAPLPILTSARRDMDELSLALSKMLK
jgi:hypothetical protein